MRRINEKDIVARVDLLRLIHSVREYYDTEEVRLYLPKVMDVIS